MFHGAFALLERSLRVDARAWATHLSRLGLMGAIYFSLCFALTTSFMFGAPGLHFFRGIAYLDATFMTLLGVGFFSTSITEEKEEDTLGLMLMAGISPLGILVGKSGGRLWQSLLLVAVQYPFVLLAVTMGGVMGTQVWSVTISLLAYMVFLSGFGLLCSTLAPRSQSAVAWMVVGLGLYFFVPLVAKEIYRANATLLFNQVGPRATPSVYWKLVEVVGEICVWTQMSDILVTSSAEPTFSIQVISNVLLGVICAGLSWLFFGTATRELSTEATTRGLVTRRSMSPFSTGVRAAAATSFHLHPCAWENPFIWKDFHFIAGGAGMLLIRTAYFGGLGIFALSIEPVSMGYWLGWFYFCVFLIWLSVTIDAARVLSRSMQEEIRGQTLASLIMLPCSPVHIVYSKFAGALMGWLPGPVIALAVTVFSSHLRQDLFQMVTQNNAGGLALTMLVLYCLLVPHFAALISLYVRWGAVALAIGMAIGLYFVAIMIVFFVMFLFGPTGMTAGPGSEHLLLGVIVLALICINAACHLGVLLRVQALAAK